MRTSLRGNSEGFCLLYAVLAIFLFSLLFVPFSEAASARARLAERTRSAVLSANELANGEVVNRHDVH